jgi:peptidylprolyl isomerase
LDDLDDAVLREIFCLMPMTQPNNINKGNSKRPARAIMQLKYMLLLGSGLLASSAVAYSASTNANSRRNFLSQSVSSAAGLVVATAGGLSANAADEEDPYKNFITTESGIKYLVTKEGTGGIPMTGQTVKAHYTGWLDGFDSDKKFDSSRDRGRPFTFKVNSGQVIRGWDESFSQMAVGERRQIVLPPRLAYGDRGAGGVIPGGATLYVSYLSVRPILAKVVLLTISLLSILVRCRVVGYSLN